MEITADYHTHTRYSHGKGTVADNVAAGVLRGLETIGIADHGFRSLPWVRATPVTLKAMQDEVATVRRQVPGIHVLAGVEANIVSLRGELDIANKTLRNLDLVLAGLHPAIIPPTVRDGWHLVVLGNLSRYCPGIRARARVVNTKAVVEAVSRHPVDIVTHPGWELDIDTGELGRACARTGTAMEVNASHKHMTVEYCRIAARQGALFAVGSDAHDPKDVGMLDAALRVVSAAGLGVDQVINSRGGAGLLRRRRTADLP